MTLLVLSDSTIAQNYVYKRQTEKKAQLAIIIDDIGYNIPLGKRTVALNGPVTLAVLPQTPGSILLAKEGYHSGKEIMLHAPMSNHQDRKLGPGGLTENMNQQDFINTLNTSIDSIPYISGVNNHMGSMLTTKNKQMEWVMKTLSKRNLYFIDSLTNSKSVAFKTAKRFGLKTLQRDIFLDHELEPDAIKAAMEKAIQRAQNNGYAIAIGHPYPETLEVLESYLPTLNERNVELVPISNLIGFNKSQQARNTSQTEHSLVLKHWTKRYKTYTP